MRAPFALGGLLLVVIAGLAIALTASHPERTGVNGVPPALYVESLHPRDVTCQGATLPAGTRAIGLTAGVYGEPGPPLNVLLIGTSIHSSIAAPAGYGGGKLRIAIPPVRREAATTICIQNLGRRALALGGVAGGLGSSTLDGHASTAALQIDYYGAAENAIQLAPTIARRVGLLALDGTGSWVLWALIALMGIAASAAIMLIRHDARSQST